MVLAPSVVHLTDMCKRANDKLQEPIVLPMLISVSVRWATLK